MGRFYQFDVGLVLSHDKTIGWLHCTWGSVHQCKTFSSERRKSPTFHMGLNGNKILEKGVCIKICICNLGERE